MSDEFLRIARQEIQAELGGLELIATHCNNDEDVYKNSKKIESHLHKIKGLAPMMGQEIIGSIAKTADVVMKYVIDHGRVVNSYKFILEAIVSMRNCFNGQQSFDIEDFGKSSRNRFPQISVWQ
jgi:chemotaxis protein histidine kinase CheA